MGGKHEHRYLLDLVLVVARPLPVVRGGMVKSEGTFLFPRKVSCRRGRVRLCERESSAANDALSKLSGDGLEHTLLRSRKRHAPSSSFRARRQRAALHLA